MMRSHSGRWCRGRRYARYLVVAGAVGLVAPTTSARAQHAGHGADASATDSLGLGRIDFPTSAKPAAHAAFVRGVLLLHNFHYPQALQAFKEAQRLDPDDVMSVWGEAMTYNHAVWNEQDSATARSALSRLGATRDARLAKARTPRERDYLGAVETLYGAGSRPARDSAYSDAMRRLHGTYPNDADAAAFYALSLLGLNQGDREAVSYAKAADLADSLFHRYPRHPGAAHYLIHAVDDPEHAARGLAAARAYSTIAPAAGHAQHMTSHIFMARGMWDDVISANLLAYRAVTKRAHVFGHGTHWLMYGLVQQGRLREARGWLDSMLTYQRDVARGATRAVNGRDDADLHAILMAATYVLDVSDWDSPPARRRFDTTYVSALARTEADFLAGISAARRAQRGEDVAPSSREADRLIADSMLARISSRIARSRAGGERPSAVGDAEVMERTLRAERYVIGNRPDSAIALLRAAAAQLEALPFEFGPPATVEPPRERAAQLLAATGRHADALVELAQSERMYPGRWQARLTKADALVALGRGDEAAQEYRALIAAWSKADDSFPPLQAARSGERRARSGGQR